MVDRRLCKAKRSDGDPCRNSAMTGLEVCRFHGGSSPAAKRKSRAEKARRQMVRFGASENISAVEAFAEVMARAMTMVRWYENQLELVPARLSGLVSAVADWSPSSAAETADGQRDERTAADADEIGNGPSLLIEEREDTEWGIRLTLKANPLLVEYRNEREHLFKVAAKGVELGLSELQITAFLHAASEHIAEANALLRDVVADPELADVAPLVRSVIARHVRSRAELARAV